MKPGDEGSQPNVRADPRAHLAWLRTHMSLDRTLAAWIRTAASLIAFGFSIVQFFSYLNHLRGVVPLKEAHLARYVGLLLIGIGTLALGVVIWQYHKAMKYLWSSEAFRGVGGVPGMRRLYPTVTVAVLLCLVGLLAFFAVLARVVLP